MEKASQAIIKAVSNSEFKDKDNLKDFRDCFAAMVNDHYLIRLDPPTTSATEPVPTLQIDHNVFEMQELPLKELHKLYDDSKEIPSDNGEPLKIHNSTFD